MRPAKYDSTENEPLMDATQAGAEELRLPLGDPMEADGDGC